MGTAVLCRRVVELFVTDLLIKRHGSPVPISKLLKEATTSGKIPKETGPGLFGILALALADGVISNPDYNIASHLREFGNNIHEKGGVQNEVDAKYAIQACIHLLHRI